MARYNVPIPGYGSMQQEWGRGLASLIDTEELENIILGFDPVVSKDYSYDQNTNKLALAVLIGYTLNRLNFNIAGYTVAFYGIARDFHLNNFQKVALVEAFTYYSNRADRVVRVNALKEILERRVPPTINPYALPVFSQFADDFKQALPRRLSNRIASSVAKDARMYKKTGDAKYLRAIKTNIRKTTLYSRALQDMTGERYPYLSDDIYMSMAGSNLWSEHTWNSIAPVDYPCIVATGETVVVGDRFSNGLVSPPVHANCFCYLTPRGILV